MKDPALTKSLHQLHEIIDGCRPRRKSEEHAGIEVPPVMSETPETGELLTELKTKLQYLVFDLEATRRENRYYRNVMRSRRRQRRLRRDEDNGRD